MKNIYYLLLFTLFLNVHSFAQNKNFEFEYGLGYVGYKTEGNYFKLSNITPVSLNIGINYSLRSINIPIKIGAKIYTNYRFNLDNIPSKTSNEYYDLVEFSYNESGTIFQLPILYDLKIKKHNIGLGVAPSYKLPYINSDYTRYKEQQNQAFYNFSSSPFYWTWSSFNCFIMAEYTYHFDILKIASGLKVFASYPLLKDNTYGGGMQGYTFDRTYVNPYKMFVSPFTVGMSLVVDL